MCVGVCVCARVSLITGVTSFGYIHTEMLCTTACVKCVVRVWFGFDHNVPITFVGAAAFSITSTQDGSGKTDAQKV